MTSIDAGATQARESARASDGKFGHQAHDRANDIDLGVAGHSAVDTVSHRIPDEIPECWSPRSRRLEPFRDAFECHYGAAAAAIAEHGSAAAAIATLDQERDAQLAKVQRRLGRGLPVVLEAQHSTERGSDYWVIRPDERAKFAPWVPKAEDPSRAERMVTVGPAKVVARWVDAASDAHSTAARVGHLTEIGDGRRPAWGFLASRQSLQGHMAAHAAEARRAADVLEGEDPARSERIRTAARRAELSLGYPGGGLPPLQQEDGSWDAPPDAIERGEQHDWLGQPLPEDVYWDRDLRREGHAWVPYIDESSVEIAEAGGDRLFVERSHFGHY